MLVGKPHERDPWKENCIDGMIILKGILENLAVRMSSEVTLLPLQFENKPNKASS
jgi:hypothetical protein